MFYRSLGFRNMLRRGKFNFLENLYRLGKVMQVSLYLNLDLKNVILFIVFSVSWYFYNIN